MGWGGAQRSEGCGCGPYNVMFANPHELADQVKQASVLNMLGLNWH